MYIKRHPHAPRMHFPIAVLLILVALMVLTVGVFQVTYQLQSEALAKHQMIEIDGYQNCVEAGYPVSETSPAQCSVPNGPTYIEPHMVGNVQGAWCKNECGNAICQKQTGTEEGSVCPENKSSCPQDCK
jgi:hypothetical protein